MSENAKSLFALLASGCIVHANAGSRETFAELWDAGLVNICLPGERYRLNAKGRAVVAELQRMAA